MKKTLLEISQDLKGVNIQKMARETGLSIRALTAFRTQPEKQNPTIRTLMKIREYLDKQGD